MRSKYNNRWTVFNGRNYQSKAEAARAAVLQEMVANGEIFDLTYQPKFVFMVYGSPVKFPSGRVMQYRGDFQYRTTKDGAQWIVEDVKGVATELWKNKWALSKAHHPKVAFRASRFKKGKWELTLD